MYKDLRPGDRVRISIKDPGYPDGVRYTVGTYQKTMPIGDELHVVIEFDNGEQTVVLIDNVEKL